MNKWSTILTNLLTNSGTAIHPSTARALLQRKFIAAKEDGYDVTRSGKVYIKLSAAIEDCGHATVYSKGKELGMYCYMEGNDIVNCWGKPMELSDVTKFQTF